MSVAQRPLGGAGDRDCVCGKIAHEPASGMVYELDSDRFCSRQRSQLYSANLSSATLHVPS